MTCPVCSKEIQDGINFCPHCSAPLNEEKQECNTEGSSFMENEIPQEYQPFPPEEVPIKTDNGDSKATAALVLGIIGFLTPYLGVFNLASLIVGIKALSVIRKNGGTKKVQAIAGIVLGQISFAAMLLLIIGTILLSVLLPDFLGAVGSASPFLFENVFSRFLGDLLGNIIDAVINEIIEGLKNGVSKKAIIEYSLQLF